VSVSVSVAVMVVKGFVDFFVVVLDEDGDLLLNQVGLVFDDGDDLVDRLGDWDWDVFNNGDDNGSGDSDSHRDWVGLGDRHGLRHMYKVGLGHLDWVRDGHGLRDGEGLGHGDRLKHGVWGEHVLNHGNDDVLGHELGHGQGFEHGIRLGDIDSFVHGVRSGDGNVLRHVFHNDFYGSGIFDMTPGVFMMVPSSGHEPYEGYKSS